MANRKDGDGKKPLILDFGYSIPTQEPPISEQKEDDYNKTLRLDDSSITTNEIPGPILRFKKRIQNSGRNNEEILNAIAEYIIGYELSKELESKVEWRKIAGANIIYSIIRYEDNWENLRLRFGATGNINDKRRIELEKIVLELRDHGLIEVELTKDNLIKESDEPIKITTKWHDLHRIIGGQSIEDLVLLNSGGISVRPIWGEIQKTKASPDIYVIMPFADEFKEVYGTHMVDVVRRQGLTIGRADDSYSSGPAMLKVWNGIYNASAIISDCTGQNPNVFYEMAIAHAMNKPTILITQNEKDIPFDIKQLDYIFYNTETEKQLNEFRDKLKEAIKDLKLGKKTSFHG